MRVPSSRPSSVGNHGYQPASPANTGSRDVLLAGRKSNSMVGLSAAPQIGACRTTLFSKMTQIGVSLSIVSSSPLRWQNQVVPERRPAPLGQDEDLADGDRPAVGMAVRGDVARHQLELARRADAERVADRLFDRRAVRRQERRQERQRAGRELAIFVAGVHVVALRGGRAHVAQGEIVVPERRLAAFEQGRQQPGGETFIEGKYHHAGARQRPGIAVERRGERAPGDAGEF